jgi:hypothetical protein
MKIFIPTDTDSAAPTTTMGGSIAVSQYAVKLRDSVRLGVQFFTGGGGFGTPYRPATSLEIVFACKVPGLREGDAVVLEDDFTWNADEQTYYGRVSFKSGLLMGLFVGDAAVDFRSASYTLVAGDEGRLLIFADSAGAVTVTVPTLSGLAVGDYIDVLRGGAQDVSIAQDTGITVTPAAGIYLTSLRNAQIIRLTKTGASTYTATLAPEADSVRLEGEVTWRDLDGDLEDWDSCAVFGVDVHADIYRGYEGTPQDLAGAGAGAGAGRPDISTFAYAATLTFDGAADRFYRIILTGNATIAVPTSGKDTKRIWLWLTASGANRTLTLHASIKIPPSATLTNPVIIASGTKTRLLLEYDQTLNQWELISHIPGY